MLGRVLAQLLCNGSSEMHLLLNLRRVIAFTCASSLVCLQPDCSVPVLVQSSASWLIIFGLAYRSLGIIYGDIGTSPLCAHTSAWISLGSSC